MSAEDFMLDTVELYIEASSDFGRGEGIYLTDSTMGSAQSMSYQESREYKAEAQSRMYRVFFVEDPSIGDNHYLKITSVSLGETFWCRVLATETEANPDGTLRIYNVVAERLSAAGVPNVL